MSCHKALWSPPARRVLGLRPRPEQKPAGCVEDAGDDEFSFSYFRFPFRNVLFGLVLATRGSTDDLTGVPELVVDGLGVRAPVGPGTTGIVEFVADSPGTWPVRLDPSGVRVGTVEVQG